MKHVKAKRNVYWGIDLRWLVILAASIFLIKVGALLLLPETPSSLAPDEGTYADLTSYVAAGLDWRSWAAEWGSTLYPSGRALMWPASLLTSAGLHPILSLRFVSALYSLLSTLMMIWIVALIYSTSSSGVARSIPLKSAGTLALLVFLLLPSHSLWSFLGLRESANEAFILVAVAGFCTVLRLNLRPQLSLLMMLVIVFSIIGAFQSRPLAAAALVVALTAASVLSLRSNFRQAVLLLTCLLTGLTLGVLTSSAQPPPTTVASAAETQQVSPDTTTPEMPDQLPPETPLTAAETQQMSPDTTTPEMPDQLPPQTDSREWDDYIRVVVQGLPVQKVLAQASDQRRASAIGAESAFEIVECRSNHLFGMIQCELERIPSASLEVTLLPLPLLSNWSELSFSARLAAIENFAWLCILVIAIGRLILYSTQFRQLTLVILAYLAIAILGMALFEGNLGTAFRHKSQLLWALCLLMAVHIGSCRFSSRRSPSRQQKQDPDRKPSDLGAPYRD